MAMAELGARGRVLTLAWLAVFLWSCTGSQAAMAQRDKVEASAGEGYELTLPNPTAEQPIGPEVTARKAAAFVQIEVTEVDNPKRIPLSFVVDVEPRQGERIHLGTFSLFPADNPGKFIVASQGKLQAGGKLSVTLTPLQTVKGDERVRVRLKRFSLLER
jgi:hypothetical protein